MSSELGMDGSCAGDKVVAGTFTTRSIPESHPGTDAFARIAPYLRDMAIFTPAAGLRRANVTGLTWEQVDRSRKPGWVHPDQAKARNAISVPLNETAIQVVREQEGQHPVRVFTCEGNPVFQASTAAWYKALARAGIENFRWHDLRHIWASWHVQGGTPLFALQEPAGWETERRRYAHLRADGWRSTQTHWKVMA